MDGSKTPKDDFLVEVMVDGAPAYVHCTPSSGVMTADSVQGMPHAALDGAFAERGLRAITVPRQEPEFRGFPQPQALVGGVKGQSMDRSEKGQSMNR